MGVSFNLNEKGQHTSLYPRPLDLQCKSVARNWCLVAINSFPVICFGENHDT